MKWNIGDVCGLFASGALKSDESRRFGRGTLKVCRAVSVRVCVRARAGARTFTRTQWKCPRCYQQLQNLNVTLYRIIRQADKNVRFFWVLLRLYHLSVSTLGFFHVD